LKNSNELMPYIWGAFVGLLTLNLWYFSALAIDKSVVPVRFEIVVALVGAVVGPFVGAYAAFRLQAREKLSERQKERKAALNAGLFTLLMQLNAVRNIKKDIEPYRTEIARAFLLPAFKHPDYSGLKQDTQSLSFLAELDYVDLLQEVHLEQIKFEQTLVSIERRNAFYETNIAPYPSTGRAALEISHNILTIKGPEVCDEAIRAAKEIYLHLEESDKSLEKAFANLRKTAKELFRDEKFVSIRENAPSH